MWLNSPKIESSTCHTNEKYMRPLMWRVSQVGANVFSKLDSIIAKTMHAMQHESVPSFSGRGGNQIVCALGAVYFSLFWGPYSSQAYLPASLPFLLFCLSYCTAISTFWVTELIVPAHAFSADSIIRHSGHPEKKKKNEGGKSGMWAKSVGEWKNEKVKCEKKGFRRS